ncbi:MAG: hypothetical protein E7543_09660 [Ruminococcaceae bacterium]|nr:hypothetical protein [Oscillospiraceae bacterium]
MKKKILSLILALSLIICCSSPAFAAEDRAPFVFVHGMMGWGEGSLMEEASPYWGLTEESNVMSYLRREGYDVYYPSVSGLGSCWDRCCELYAQLTGTVVDYGEAHSKKYGHARYGRDYTGKATMGEPWDVESEINIVGHSLGGPTVRLFASLLAYGDEAEIEASGENCSGLFTGGHNKCINSVITLSGVHNGTIVANYATDLFFPALLIAIGQNISLAAGGIMDPMLDQWGFIDEDGNVKVSLLKCMKVIKSGDYCGEDLSIGGAAKLNEQIKTVPDTYYFSYTVRATEPDLLGIETPIDNIFPLFRLTAPLISLSRGLMVDGVILDKSWLPSDGIVPLRSALYPDSEENNHMEYTEGMDLKTGIWYTMPTMNNYDHYDFCKIDGGFGTTENLFAFYTDMLEMIYSLS